MRLIAESNSLLRKMAELPKQRRIRADALRNREQILLAAVGLLVKDGPTVALDAIAREAGVGIATLYRHFPDRTVLLRQVAVGVLRQATAAARVTLAEEPDAFTALSRYLHDAIDIRIGVILPVLSDRLLADDEVNAARDESQKALDALVKAAHDEGSLRTDIGAGDIILLMIRMSPPLPVDISAEENRRLSHRQLELILDGLLRFLAVGSLPGRSLDAEELGLVPPNRAGRYKLTTAPAADTADRSTTSGS